MNATHLTEDLIGHCKGQIDGKYNVYSTIGRGQFAKYVWGLEG
jgi:hypothetical protein